MSIMGKGSQFLIISMDNLKVIAEDFCFSVCELLFLR
jgi:hypothetical protein